MPSGRAACQVRRCPSISYLQRFLSFNGQTEWGEKPREWVTVKPGEYRISQIRRDAAWLLPTAKTFEKKTGTFELTQSGATFDISLAYSAAWDGVTTLEPALVDGVYQISNGYELVWFRDKVNEGTSASYALNAILTDNIDLGGHEWTAISVVTDTSAKKGYIGTFDGNGKTISNLNPIGSSVESYGRVSINGAGLFGFVYTGGVIKNVTVEGTLAAVKFSGGIVAILANGTVENCVSKLTITLHPDCTDGYAIGGIVGSMKDYTSNAGRAGYGCDVDRNLTQDSRASVLAAIMSFIRTIPFMAPSSSAWPVKMLRSP